MINVSPVTSSDTVCVPEVDAAKRSTRLRLLVAMSERERNLFFPEKPCELLADTCDYRQLDGKALSNPEWSWHITEIQPHIILSGWGTKPLPLQWVEREDCPLRYLCHVTGSVRHLIPRSFIERGGLVSNWGGLAAPGVAEHALLLALAALRNMGLWREVMETRKAKGFRKEILGTRSLYGRRVGLHGYGRVARALNDLLKPFQVNISAYSKEVPDTVISNDGVRPAKSLSELFASNDVIFECEALNAGSRGSVSAEILSQLPDGAVFVNVGRGEVVDEEALIREAASGRIRLALDVAASEPVLAGNPLLSLKDAILSPHIGGPTLDHYHLCGELAIANLRKFLNGESVNEAMDTASYDRST